MTKRRRIILVAFTVVGIGMVTSLAISEDIPKIKMMSIDELRSMLDNPDLAIIDVRYDKDWEKSDMKIKGAVREDYMRVETWADRYPKGKPIVLYCA